MLLLTWYFKVLEFTEISDIRVEGFIRFHECLNVQNLIKTIQTSLLHRVNNRLLRIRISGSTPILLCHSKSTLYQL